MLFLLGITTWTGSSPRERRVVRDLVSQSSDTPMQWGDIPFYRRRGGLFTWGERKVDGSWGPLCSCSADQPGAQSNPLARCHPAAGLLSILFMCRRESPEVPGRLEVAAGGAPHYSPCTVGRCSGEAPPARPGGSLHSIVLYRDRVWEAPYYPGTQSLSTATWRDDPLSQHCLRARV